jgi:hypothetical protein
MTERRAKRAQYKVAEKQLRALDKRRKSLWKAEFLYVELEKPLFVGYEKYFAFRDDILMRPDFPILEKLLELINEVLSNIKFLIWSMQNGSNCRGWNKITFLQEKSRQIGALIWCMNGIILGCSCRKCVKNGLHRRASPTQLK